MIASVQVPNDTGIPPDHVAVVSARGTLPVVKRIPGLLWNTHASQIFWPAETATGADKFTVCQPALALTVVEAVTPSRAPGLPALSAYTARIIWPAPPW